MQLLVGAAGFDAGCAGAYGAAQPSLGGQTNPDGGPATCGTCSCLVPDAGAQRTIQVEQDNTGCLPIFGTPVEVTVPVATCKAVGGFNGWNGKVSTPAATGGAQCNPQGGAVTAAPPPPTYSTAVACAQPDAGSGSGDGGAGIMCQSGQACAAMPAGGDGGMPSGVCIYQSGVQSCPPSGTTVFTNTFVVGSVEDSRGCTCTCGAPTCPSDGYVGGFAAAGCSGTPAYTGDAGAGCNSNISTNPKYVEYYLSRSGALGGCGAASVAPSGAVDIDGGTATTFCCVP